MNNNISNVYPLFGARKEGAQPRKNKTNTITCKSYNEGLLIDLDDLGGLQNSNTIYIKLDGKIAMTIAPSS